MPPSDALAIVTLAAGLLIAAVIDLRTRRVPNVVTGAIAATGVALALAGATSTSLGAALAGLAVGAALMLPGHLIGATGAGDVKLFAAAGSLLGPGLTLRAFVATIVAGGLVALVVAARRGRLRQTLRNTAGLVTRRADRAAIAGPAANNRFAYAPAIALGTLAVALGA